MSTAGHHNNIIININNNNNNLLCQLQIQMARSSEKCGRAGVVRCWNNSILPSLAVQSISQERINQNRTNATLTHSVSAAGRGGGAHIVMLAKW